MKLMTLTSALLLSFTAFAQNTYWQQQANFSIDVTLNVADKSIKATEQIEYKNNSPETLQFIWFHIWPNAYKNEKTALYKQYKKGDKEGMKKFEKAEKGFIDSLAFTVNGSPATFEPHPDYNDVIKLVLPQPLAPGATITIQTPFYVKFPTYFSRSGFIEDAFAVCQWYPKPAVFDKEGWHPMPYLNMGEYYSEFGNYVVNITVPSNYIVGASGQLQNEDELKKYKEAGALNLTKTENFVKYKPDGTAAFKTLQYKAENVHDFAWFTDNDFLIQYDTLQLSSGKIVDAFTFFSDKANTKWSKSVSYVEDAVRSYSKWIGEYPYPTVNAVEGPGNVSSGGMEYPMVTLITSPDANEETLDGVITHEVGHNWFYGILGSNERKFPWMDEGLNTYYQFRYEAEKYRANSIFGSSLPAEFKLKEAKEFQSIIYNAVNENIPMKEAISTPSEDFKSKDDYGMVIYLKTALWAYITELTITREALDKGLQLYFNRWKFKHPSPADFKQCLEEACGKNLDSLFEILNKTGKL
jgi:Peptidase family M1 domain